MIAALRQSVKGTPSPQEAVLPFAFLNSFLRSIPITLGFLLYLLANYYAHSKNLYSGYS